MCRSIFSETSQLPTGEHLFKTIDWLCKLLVLEMVLILPLPYVPESHLVLLLSSGEKECRGYKHQIKLCFFHMHSLKALQAFLSNFYKSTYVSLRNKLTFHCFPFQYFYLIILINSTSYMGRNCVNLTWH